MELRRWEEESGRMSFSLTRERRTSWAEEERISGISFS